MSVFNAKAIKYAFPSLCAFQSTNATIPVLRLYIPAITCSTITQRTDNDCLNIIEKNGSKIGIFYTPNQGNICIDLGEWDNPAWLNQLMSG